MKVTLHIDALAAGGEGVARLDGRAVFVPGTAPGDRVEAEVGEGETRGQLLAVVEPSPQRVDPPCKHFGDCGGCEWLHVRYEAQLAAKESGLVETLRKVAKLSPVDAPQGSRGLEPGGYALSPAIPSPAPTRYRARAKFHVDGYFGKLAFMGRRSHEAIPLDECHLLSPGLEALREAVAPALRAARLGPREVTLEWSELDAKGSALLDVAQTTPAIRDRARAMLRDLPQLAGLVLQAGSQPLLLVGEPVLRQPRDPADPAKGAQRSRPDVFLQSNRGANAKLVEAALEWLAPGGAEVLELFCGAGNFTAPLAARAKAVTAVELQGPGLELARKDAEGAANVRFVAGDGLKLALAFAREKKRFDAVLLDPPRAGMKGLGPALRDLGVPRAVYVSCDPATFARDLRGCADAGLRVTRVRAVDLFPQTHHVEAVALVER